jgi:hypothetical protein
MEAGLEYEGSKEAKQTRQVSKWLKHFSKADIEEELAEAPIATLKDVAVIKEQFKAASRPKKLRCPSPEPDDAASSSIPQRSPGVFENSTAVSPYSGKLTSLGVSAEKSRISKKAGKDDASTPEGEAPKAEMHTKDDLLVQSENAGQAAKESSLALPHSVHWKVCVSSAMSLLVFCRSAMTHVICVTGTQGSLARCTEREPVTRKEERGGSPASCSKKRQARALSRQVATRTPRRGPFGGRKPCRNKGR